MKSILDDICRYDAKLGSLFIKKISSKDISKNIADDLLFAIPLSYSSLPLYENIDFFLKSCNYKNIINLYKLVKDNEDAKNKVKKYMTEHIDEIIECSNPRKLLEIAPIFEGEVKTKIENNLLSNFDKLIKSYSPMDLFNEFVDDVKYLPTLKNKRKEYINSNFDEIIKKLYYALNTDSIKNNNLSIEQKNERESIINIMQILFKEVAENEKVDYSDIKILGEGTYSIAFEVGEKVIKIGNSRATKSYPNNPYVLKPLLRKSFSVEGTKWYEGIFMEITELVDTLKEDEVSEEELYDLYSKMRNIGLEWLDVHYSNVGRLRKDNIIHWQEDIYPSDETLELNPSVGQGISLKKGDLVILDADFIFEEGYIPNKMIDSSDEGYVRYVNLWTKFNERYNKEHYEMSSQRNIV